MEVLEKALWKMKEYEREGTEALLTPKEVSALLEVNIRTLANWRCKGKGPGYIKIGSLVRYPASYVKKYIERHLLPSIDILDR